MLEMLQNHQAKLAAAAALAGFATYMMLPKIMATFKRKDQGPRLLPALTEEETLRVLSKVFDKLKMQAARMVTAAENIRAQIEQQGQHIDDDKLMKHFILPHFETSMAEIYAKAYEENDVDADELDDATEYYSKNGRKDIKEITNKINILHREFGGNVEVDDEEDVDGNPIRDLAVQEVVEILETLAERMGDVTDSYVEEFKEAHGIPDQHTIMAFQEGMMALSEDMEKSVLEEYNITMMEFQKVGVSKLDYSLTLLPPLTHSFTD